MPICVINIAAGITGAPNAIFSQYLFGDAQESFVFNEGCEVRGLRSQAGSTAVFYFFLWSSETKCGFQLKLYLFVESIDLVLTD